MSCCAAGHSRTELCGSARRDERDAMRRDTASFQKCILENWALPLGDLKIQRAF